MYEAVVIEETRQGRIGSLGTSYVNLVLGNLLERKALETLGP